MRWLIILALSAPLSGGWPQAARGGTIAGWVRAEGKAGAGSASGTGGAYDGRKFKFVERVNYATMQDFIVYLEGVLSTPNPATTNTAVVETRRNITQKGARFTPRVLPVMVGTTVEWPNHDEIFHNVFSISEPKQFDLGLYKHPELKRVKFEHPGRVDAFCSIHTAMHCIILVLENPYFAATDSQGRYRIADVPPGTYKLKAWHERLPSQSRAIVVPADGIVQADFTLGIINLPQY
jgi:plastocyanin